MSLVQSQKWKGRKTETEVFISMIYLINRLSSSLSKAVPYTTLFNKQPHYTHLRVIAYLCFP
jgi:hypothetical protein